MAIKGSVMTIRRILGTILLILGIGLYFLGSYISGEVAEGQKKISNAQKSVDQTRGLTKLSPYTKGIGDMASDSAQKKIDAGKQEVIEYQVIANWLHGGGIGLFIVGASLLVLSFIHKKRT